MAKKRAKRASKKTRVATSGGTTTATKADAAASARADRKRLDALEEHAGTCAELYRSWQDVKLEASEAKKAFDTALMRLMNMGQARDEPELLRRMDPLGWRGEPLEKVFASADDVEKMKAKCATKKGTLGELADWLNGNDFSKLRGWGPEKSTKLADELDEFWKSNPQWVPGPAEDGE